MSELHVVLGASGALGCAVVHHLVEAEGLPVRAVARDANKAAEMLPEGAEIAACDVVTDREGLSAACRGAGVIYNCVYVTGQLREVTNNVLAAAKQAGARLVQPSNGLVYGPLRQVPATEDHPQAPTSRRGMLRKEIEMTMLWAHERGEVPVVLPRLPTFYGAHVLGTFISAIFEAAYKDKRAFWLGRLDVPHDFIYLPDAAAACVLLALNDKAYGQAWHVPGSGPLTGQEFIQRVFAAFGKPPKVGVRPGGLFRLFGLFSSQVAEIGEVMYQFERPFILDGAKFAAAYPDFTYTPHGVGIEDTARWYAGYLDELAKDDLR